MSRLEVHGVWKSYPVWPVGTRTLRAVLSRRTPVALRRGARRWALQDVSLQVAPGESVGIIGHNGAGKSTLLRLVSGLGRPTQGRIAAPRETASVLSLGSLFDMALSGRENLMTTAIVLGFSASRARAVVPAALEFAELQDFADAPVRIYSEGMKLRLAFGVIAQLEPELLVVDEALAVGDIDFQARCVTRIREMRDAGTGLLLASHDLAQVIGECERVVWLHGGLVRASGSGATVVAAYRDAGRAETLARTPAAQTPSAAKDGLILGVNRFGSQELTIEDVRVHGPAANPVEELLSGEHVSISLQLRPHRAGLADPVLLASIVRRSDELVCAECSSAGALPLGAVEGPVDMTLSLDRVDLAPGDYALNLGVYPADWSYAYDFHWHSYPLRMRGAGGGEGILRIPHRWARRAPA